MAISNLTESDFFVDKLSNRYFGGGSAWFVLVYLLILSFFCLPYSVSWILNKGEAGNGERFLSVLDPDPTDTVRKYLGLPDQDPYGNYLYRSGSFQ